MKIKHSKFGIWSWIVSLVLLLGIGFGWGGNARADTTSTANVTINGGDFSISPPSTATFAPVTLTGDVQSATTDFTNGLKVTDARGTGAGWKIQVSASQFSDGTNTLPKSSLTLKNADDINAGYSDSGYSPAPADDTGFTGSVVIDDGTLHPFVDAASGAGMGKWNIGWSTGNNNLSLVLHPAFTKTSATAYSSTITWTLAVVPN